MAPDLSRPGAFTLQSSPPAPAASPAHGAVCRARSLAFVSSALSLLLGISFSAPAGAEEQSAEAARARADTLFERGLAQQGLAQYQAACESFEASVALAPTPHAWLQVGNCREPLDPVGALASFEAALAAAAAVDEPARRQAYAAAARQRIEPLQARVATLSVRSASTPDISVELTDASGGGRLELKPLGEPRRFNPGRYRLRAWAPGSDVYVAEVDLRAGQRVELEIPRLAPLPSQVAPPSHPAVGAESAPAPAQPAVAPERAGTSSKLPVAFITGGAGLLVASIVTGQVSSSARRELERECGAYDEELGYRPCPPSAASTKSRVEDYALATDVLWIAGAVVAGVGVTLFVLDQDTPEPVELEAGCFPQGCGLSAVGSF